MPRRAVAAAAVLLAVAALAALATAGAHRLPKAPGCPILPKRNAFNQRVDRLPVASDSATLVSSIGADARFSADFGSGTYEGGPIGIPYAVVGKRQKKVPVTFEYADESDRGPYPIPPRASIEGGPNADGDRHCRRWACAFASGRTSAATASARGRRSSRGR